jgi:hypothetical protein
MSICWLFWVCLVDFFLLKKDLGRSFCPEYYGFKGFLPSFYVRITMSAASEVENIENNTSVESAESSYVTRVAASQTVITRRSVSTVTVQKNAALARQYHKRALNQQ